MVYCRAKVEDSGEQPALILEQLIPVQEALVHFRGGLQIGLCREDQGLLQQLLDALGRHSGKSPLFLQVTGTDGVLRRVRASRERNVSISEELASELIELLGDGRVALVRV